MFGIAAHNQSASFSEPICGEEGRRKGGRRDLPFPAPRYNDAPSSISASHPPILYVISAEAQVPGVIEN